MPLPSPPIHVIGSWPKKKNRTISLRSTVIKTMPCKEDSWIFFFTRPFSNKLGSWFYFLLRPWADDLPDLSSFLSATPTPDKSSQFISESAKQVQNPGHIAHLSSPKMIMIVPLSYHGSLLPWLGEVPGPGQCTLYNNTSLRLSFRYPV